MEQIGFIGAFDKKDIILNVGKTIAFCGKRTLIVDATSLQRLKYIVPSTQNGNTPTYVSEYQGMDVALGFMNLMQIQTYLGKQLDYDFVLVDTDNAQTMNSFMVPKMKRVFFCTSYDIYDTRRGAELLRFVQTTLRITKLVISPDLSAPQKDLLNNIIKKMPTISWAEEQVIIADEMADRRNTLENQLTNRLLMKKYTENYKAGIEYTAALSADGIIDQSQIRRALAKL